MESQHNQNYTDSLGYNNISALQIRLSTDPIIEKIEIFLRGEKIVATRDDNGNIVTQRVQFGKPKCNEEGIQSILNLVTSTFNSQTVQGNFTTEDMYWNYVQPFEISLIKTIMLNLYTWEIKIKDYSIIVDTIMGFLIPFMSRLIKNGERDSYSNTMQIRETSMVRDNSGSRIPFRRGE